MALYLKEGCGGELRAEGKGHTSALWRDQRQKQSMPPGKHIKKKTNNFFIQV